MKKIIIIAAALAVAGSAEAADLLPMKTPAAAPAAYSWTGPYLGVNAGAAYAGDAASFAGATAPSALAVATGAVPSSLDTSGLAPLAGGTAGYNYQQGSWVFGAEADFDWEGLGRSASRTLTTAPLGFPASLTAAATRRVDWLSTIRGRIGTTLFSPGTMVYATAGAAIAEASGGASIALGTPVPGFSAAVATAKNQTVGGWVAGAGVESAIFGGWTWKAEYLYVSLGNINGTLSPALVKLGGTTFGFTANQPEAEHILRAGLNYRF